jgi:ATP-binding cassette subfamily B protein/subfamily B ATP-binding cassette protein MsbA
MSLQTSRARSSRRRYLGFVKDYRDRRLDDAAKPPVDAATAPDAAPEPKPPGPHPKRREYLREYVRWLWPHRYGVGLVFLLALAAGGLQMVEPLFMRFIIDRVLLDSTLARADRLFWLNAVGGAFLAVMVISNLIGVTRDYRQRLLNIRVMLVLRRCRDSGT